MCCLSSVSIGRVPTIWPGWAGYTGMWCPSRMADRRAGDTVLTSGRFLDGIPDVVYGQLYEWANAGSDRRDFSVARSIDVIAVVVVNVLFPRG